MDDNIFNTNASLPYGPPVNTDTGYYWTYFENKWTDHLCGYSLFSRLCKPTNLIQ